MKTVLIILVVIALAVVVFLFNRQTSIAPTINGSPTSDSIERFSESPLVTATGTPATSSSLENTASPKTTVKTVIVTFRDGTASPLNIEIKVGDTVKFMNDDDIKRWPASGIHPTHQICPDFDSLQGLETGESYSFTFNEAKTCPWHDHLLPSLNGQIVINP